MKPALLVIDFINDIVHPKGKIARSAEQVAKNKVIQHANQMISHAKGKKWQLVFVKVGFHAGYPECPTHSPLFSAAPNHGALLLDSWGTAFHEELAIEASDFVLVKHRVSCFYATALEAILRAQEIDTLILVGVATNMAIEHTARDGHDRDYKTVVISDACAAHSEDAHKASLENMGRFAKIMDTESFIRLEIV